MSAFRDNKAVAWGIVGATLLLFAASSALLTRTANVRYERDINRIVFNRNWELLDDVAKGAGLVNDSLETVLSESPIAPKDRPYLVVSITDRRLWYKQGPSTLFTTQVAVGSGKTLVANAGKNTYKFDTPRGRLVVQNKEIGPVWVPPDWHFQELAKKKGLGVVRLNRGQTLPAPGSGGGVIAVSGNDVVRQFSDGRTLPLDGGEGREIVVGGNIVIPPFGTNQRRYDGVLGTHRLNMGDGYALHGTDKPQSIGQAVSHGCIRLRNEDIAYLYGIVPVGTPVFIY